MLEVSVIDVLSHGPCLVMSCPVFDEDLREQDMWPSGQASMSKYYGSQSPVLGLKHDGIEGCKSYHSFGHSNWKIQSARRGGGFPSCHIQAECHDVSMRNKGRNGSKCKALDIESYRNHSLSSGGKLEEKKAEWLSCIEGPNHEYTKADVFSHFLACRICPVQLSRHPVKCSHSSRRRPTARIHT